MPGKGAPLTRIAGRGRGWYRGDLHVHSVYSDGRLKPAELAAAARAAGLDFIATTDHNTTAAHWVWREAAGDDLLVILGEEVTAAESRFARVEVRHTDGQMAALSNPILLV